MRRSPQRSPLDSSTPDIGPLHSALIRPTISSPAAKMACCDRKLEVGRWELRLGFSRGPSPPSPDRVFRPEGHYTSAQTVSISPAHPPFPSNPPIHDKF